jgi:hypothetical protein
MTLNETLDRLLGWVAEPCVSVYLPMRLDRASVRVQWGPNLLPLMAAGQTNEHLDDELLAAHMREIDSRLRPLLSSADLPLRRRRHRLRSPQWTYRYLARAGPSDYRRRRRGRIHSSRGTCHLAAPRRRHHHSPRTPRPRDCRPSLLTRDTNNGPRTGRGFVGVRTLDPYRCRHCFRYW